MIGRDPDSFRHSGTLYATKLLGNSPSILLDHYVPVSKLNLK